ncbi:porphobilinogen synthase [Aggregicoccus sp. 17bor-14]|uniref:porphobilinogen synthase n=1 Tax=Myxococcaceae TaxID=31 RepID=UPI00129CEA69|nr:MULTISPECIES: porphobilinogen synthase [Myxococcaceae]MBF5044091.1 porphobilinogen synthase [Simulacricoccus sp. 17bor-14]MRI89842.1 porphobilinogen synthase [Aggregicoccus sp. 17bor-14]
MTFPVHRPRRLRRSAALREMVRETSLAPSDFILPLFVVEGRDVRRPVTSMPGVFNLSVEHAVAEAKQAHALGVRSVILFGIPDAKDARGSGAYAREGIVQRALSEIKSAVPELQLIADVCLCEYTDHGHCGVIEGGHVANDASLPLLAQMAVTCAQAGADIIAPSDMMDGRVGAIRRALDEVRLTDTPIMAYSAKYASGFYGPFREAAQSAPQFGDRRGYQMDPGNAREALKETALDLEEGADMVMVKPALSYLDIIHRVKERFDVPVAAYNVSGEYAMVKAAAQNGWIDGERVMLEVLTSIKRAGADLILTYHALEAASLL